MKAVSNTKSKASQFGSFALVALALALLIPTAANAGREQMAALQAPSMDTPSKGFDLVALETKLSNTDALNFIAKLKLRHGINSLTEEFGAFHSGRSTRSLSELRQRFEEFLYRTVASLREGDPSLARELALSRDDLWKLLTNPGGEWETSTEQ